MNFKTFLFPKDLKQKKYSMEYGFFALMVAYMATGIFLFFIMTGFKLRLVLTYPMVALMLIMMSVGLIYLSYLSRKMAISSREADSLEVLREIFIFFQKRAFQLFHLPLILLGASLYKLNEFQWATGVILIGVISQLVMFLSEWKLIIKKEI